MTGDVTKYRPGLASGKGKKHTATRTRKGTQFTLMVADVRGLARSETYTLPTYGGFHQTGAWSKSPHDQEYSLLGSVLGPLIFGLLPLVRDVG